ncbi:uncharacterized protein LOC114263990 [Camellia sinensis]|uniref:uncharacterized protein LOC114263990 n=1 Tax=Camellia sinensis TaxID=4442 RepID=UPI001035E74F|nr:uncharacterized protein LOC114263990 [Camellia sinensis]
MSSADHDPLFGRYPLPSLCWSIFKLWPFYLRFKYDFLERRHGRVSSCESLIRFNQFLEQGMWKLLNPCFIDLNLLLQDISHVGVCLWNACLWRIGKAKERSIVYL